MDMDLSGFDAAALKCMAAYGWPGNVRELENVVERAMVLADGETIETEDLPEIVRDPDSTIRISSDNLSSDELSVKKRTAELERHLIARALEVTEGNRTRAADLLDLSYRALLYKIRDYGLG
jgi:two-component system response regulator AtoC